MTKISQRQRARAAYGELDEIVVQLFDDLATEGELPESAVPAARRAASSQPGSRRPNHRPMPASTADSAPRRDLGVRLARNAASENEPDGPAPRAAVPDQFDIERLFPDESQREDDADSLMPEEEKFIEHVVAWLAPRPNADLLLDRIEDTLWLNAAGVSRHDPAEKEHGDESAPPETAAEAKPTQGEK
jgi:hypothetical protein